MVFPVAGLTLSIDMVGSLFREAGPLKWVVPRGSEDEIDAQDSLVGAAAFLEAILEGDSDP
jgi:hypothetical protein